MSRVHSFQSSLKKGVDGELALMEVWPGLVRLAGRKSDFVIEATQELMELKTDQYDMRLTPNFFFERFSNAEKGTDGGPWQALHHGSKYIFYWYAQNKVGYLFEVVPLILVLDKLIQRVKPSYINNKSYTTIGFKVPRASVMHLATEKDFSNVAKLK